MIDNLLLWNPKPHLRNWLFQISKHAQYFFLIDIIMYSLPNDTENSVVINTVIGGPV